MGLFNRKSLKKSQLVIFYSQLATLQSTGIPLLQALQIMRSNKSSMALLILTNHLHQKLASGYSLSKALSNHFEFDALRINLIALGENTGQLHIILTLLAKQLEKEVKLHSKLHQAMVYPGIVLSIAATAISILLIKVVPTFTAVFASLGAELSTATSLILTLSQTLSQHWLKLSLVLVALLFCIKQYSSRLGTKIPIIRNLLHKMQIINFCNALAISGAAGMPLQQVLTLIAKTYTNKEFVIAMQIIKQSIVAGKSLHVALRLSKFFPPLLLQMVAIAEETASLDNMLQKVASIYEEELDLSLERFITLLEPILMLLIGVIVGGLVITIYMPIFNLGAVI